jgi:hypothetical protein
VPAEQNVPRWQTTPPDKANLSEEYGGLPKETNTTCASFASESSRSTTSRGGTAVVVLAVTIHTAAFIPCAITSCPNECQKQERKDTAEHHLEQQQHLMCNSQITARPNNKMQAYTERHHCTSSCRCMAVFPHRTRHQPKRLRYTCSQNTHTKSLLARLLARSNMIRCRQTLGTRQAARDHLTIQVDALIAITVQSAVLPVRSSRTPPVQAKQPQRTHRHVAATRRACRQRTLGIVWHALSNGCSAGQEVKTRSSFGDLETPASAFVTSARSPGAQTLGTTGEPDALEKPEHHVTHHHHRPDWRECTPAPVEWPSSSKTG